MPARTEELGWYLRNCLSGPQSDELLPVVEAFAQNLGEDDFTGSEEIDAMLSRAAPRGKARRKKKDVSTQKRRDAVSALLVDYAEPPRSSDTAAVNARFAREEFSLSDLDLDILLLVLRYPRNSMLEDFADTLLHRLRSAVTCFATMLTADPDQVRERLSPTGPLIENGILTHSPDGVYLCGSEGAVQVSRSVYKAMSRPHGTREEWSEALLGRPVAEDLAWSDYAHLGDQGDLARRLLSGWGGHGDKGVNIFLVGPPGTGKTAFAATLSAAAGRKLWSVGEKDEDGDEPNRLERLSSLRLAVALLRNRKDATLLLDEAEDVLEAGWSYGSNKSDISKAYLNRLLDSNAIPVIWTCNSMTSMDPAVLRRMTLLIEMKLPDRPVRERIWGRVLDREGLVLPPGAAARLSSRWTAPPAVAANASRAARIAGGGEADVETALLGVMTALDGGMAKPERDGSAFDHELSSCDEDLEALTERLARPGAQMGWSICLDGPPGTGKSEFARHLASRIGIKVVQKRASDLVSKWVGETEQKIAAAFAEARTKRSMLIIDEAESMLMDRAGATNSWQVSQVDEMLTWMEDLSWPLVCTTNLVDQLDKASLRRFTFKLHLKALDPARAAVAFRRILGHEPPGALPDGLAPGDFSVVRRKATLMGVSDPAILLQWIRDEASAKNPNARVIGFGGHSQEKARMQRL